MSLVARVGYMSAFLVWLGIVGTSLIAYAYHVFYLFSNLDSLAYSGYQAYLIVGCAFPPLGIFNGLVLLLT